MERRHGSKRSRGVVVVAAATAGGETQECEIMWWGVGRRKRGGEC